MSEPRRAPHLPRIHPAAWHGALGETVRRIAPGTEADPVAILASCLALFGAIAGDNAWIRVGGARHPARIWPLIIGKTGSGRKGTSFNEARSTAREWSGYARAYAQSRVVSGLASGEGLIAALGGAVGNAAGEQEATAPDGKLTVLETEFARTLSAAKRDGSTLGPILRQLWDDGGASILTRAAPLTVRDAHLTVVAHITPHELKLRLAEADLSGGTLNRFLLIASERPHLISHEPRARADTTDAAEWLGKALDGARLAHGEVRRDPAAEELWGEVYAALCDDEPDGTLGAVLARGPAYTMRLALTYALADNDGAIRPKHLIAGLAVWQYAAATARRLFPDTSRDDVDRLARYIADAGQVGRTKTDISRLFAGNRNAEQLRQMVAELERKQRIEGFQEVPAGGVGRTIQRYRTTGRAIDRMSELLSKYELNELTI